MNAHLTINGKPSTEEEFLEKFRAISSRPVYLTSLELQDCWLVQMQQQGGQPELSCEVTGLTRAIRGKLLCRQYLDEPLWGGWPLGKHEEVACRKREKAREWWRKNKLGHLLGYWLLSFGILNWFFEPGYAQEHLCLLGGISFVIASLLTALIQAYRDVI